MGRSRPLPPLCRLMNSKPNARKRATSPVLPMVAFRGKSPRTERIWWCTEQYGGEIIVFRRPM